MKHTIAIVDDHVLIANALHNIINNFIDFEVLYECHNGQELQEKFEDVDNVPNIVLLDISMPIMDGYETAVWLKNEHPNVLVLILSMQDDEESVIKMIKRGAKGYLLKNAHPAELEKALLTLIKNNFFFPDWAMSKVFTNLEDNEVEEILNTIKFSEREKEFLTFCATEMSYKEIGDKMFVSPRTVESYRDSVCGKIDIKTRVGLAVFAIKNGFC